MPESPSHAPLRALRTNKVVGQHMKANQRNGTTKASGTIELKDSKGVDRSRQPCTYSLKTNRVVQVNTKELMQHNPTLPTMYCKRHLVTRGDLTK